MIVYERSESARYNFGKFIHQFQPETKTLIKKYERILTKLCRKNWLLVVWVLWHTNLCRLFNAKFSLYVYTFNQIFLNEYLVGKIIYERYFVSLHMINQF